MASSLTSSSELLGSAAWAVALKLNCIQYTWCCCLWQTQAPTIASCTGTADTHYILLQTPTTSANDQSLSASINFICFLKAPTLALAFVSHWGGHWRVLFVQREGSNLHSRNRISKIICQKWSEDYSTFKLLLYILYWSRVILIIQTNEEFDTI